MSDDEVTSQTLSKTVGLSGSDGLIVDLCVMKTANKKAFAVNKAIAHE